MYFLFDFIYSLYLLCTFYFISYRIAKEISQEQLGKDKSGNKGGDGLFYESVDDLRDDRISFEKYEKVESDTLFINATTMEDRGRYNCTAKNKATNFRNSYIPAERGCYVRIKGTTASFSHLVYHVFN